MTCKSHSWIFDVKSIKNPENSHNFHKNPENIDHFTGKFLFHTCIMNKHEQNMQICDIQRGTYHIWHMLAFVLSTLISRTLVALLFPEGFIIKVKVFLEKY